MPASAHDAGFGGGAAASPNASAADWFDGESFDQTDGFGDERGDVSRNVRPKHEAGACLQRVDRSYVLTQVFADIGGGAAADDGDFTKQLLLMEQQEM